MPILNVKVSGDKDVQVTRKITTLLLDTTTRILKKKPEVTAITIQYVPSDCWVIGGELLSEQSKSSFYLDIKVTDETNTKDEKADYIREVFEGFKGILGDLHDESYIYVEDVRAAAYGYGGRTQEFRYQQ
jgi:4-oxalocrotonate tautomerase